MSRIDTEDGQREAFRVYATSLLESLMKGNWGRWNKESSGNYTDNRKFIPYKLNEIVTKTSDYAKKMIDEENLFIQSEYYGEGQNEKDS